PVQAAIILAAGAASALLAVFVPAFARLFLRKVRAEVEVRQYAQSMFLDRHVFAAPGRRGVLVLVSLFERRIEILADAGFRDRLTAAMKAHEDATTNQIAVLTVPTIQPDSIEDYAVKVFASWKLGQKGKDNGVLVVVVPNDHKMRIEVGYGLEPVLTDGAAG